MKSHSYSSCYWNNEHGTHTPLNHSKYDNRQPRVFITSLAAHITSLNEAKKR